MLLLHHFQIKVLELKFVVTSLLFFRLLVASGSSHPTRFAALILLGRLSNFRLFEGKPFDLHLIC
jgi:hypothetical protein